MKDKIYSFAPHVVQNLMVSLFNYIAYKSRYGTQYFEFRKIFEANRTLTLDELKSKQAERYGEFLEHAKQNSSFYKNRISSSKIEDLESNEIVDKETLRANIKEVYTIAKSEGIVSKTGGTTGKSLEVLFTKDDMQERFAMLDDFRSRFGYALGKKTAWFSGKNLLGNSDVKKNRFWKTDNLYHVRYYSTFHIKNDYLKYYVEDLMKFQPEYIVGFPSTILEIAKYGIKNGYNFPANTIKAIFPTAETITAEMLPIETFFKSKMYNQYASSEGAPFIIECQNRNLHLELQSGVFEVLDHNNQPAQSGKLILTSFTTNGTPLIRYDIGDSIALEDPTLECSCGNNNPMVKEILGRVDDFIYSPENGKINLGNVSNTLKDTLGIVKFQAIQNSLDTLDVIVIIDSANYTDEIEKIFIKNWRNRIGSKMVLNLKYVSDIPSESSGKFRMVKNNIKNLLP